MLPSASAAAHPSLSSPHQLSDQRSPRQSLGFEEEIGVRTGEIRKERVASPTPSASSSSSSSAASSSAGTYNAAPALQSAPPSVSSYGAPQAASPAPALAPALAADSSSAILTAISLSSGSQSTHSSKAGNGGGNGGGGSGSGTGGNAAGAEAAAATLGSASSSSSLVAPLWELSPSPPPYARPSLSAQPEIPQLSATTNSVSRTANMGTPYAATESHHAGGIPTTPNSLHVSSLSTAYPASSLPNTNDDQHAAARSPSVPSTVKARTGDGQHYYGRNVDNLEMYGSDEGLYGHGLVGDEAPESPQWDASECASGAESELLFQFPPGNNNQRPLRSGEGFQPQSSARAAASAAASAAGPASERGGLQRESALNDEGHQNRAGGMMAPDEAHLRSRSQRAWSRSSRSNDEGEDDGDGEDDNNSYDNLHGLRNCGVEHESEQDEELFSPLGGVRGAAVARRRRAAAEAAVQREQRVADQPQQQQRSLSNAAGSTAKKTVRCISAVGSSAKSYAVRGSSCLHVFSLFADHAY